MCVYDTFYIFVYCYVFLHKCSVWLYLLRHVENGTSYHLCLRKQERGWGLVMGVVIRRDAEMGVFMNYWSSEVLGKLLLSSECLNLDSEFTLQTIDPRLLSILAEHAEWVRRKHPAGVFPRKVLDVRTQWEQFAPTPRALIRGRFLLLGRRRWEFQKGVMGLLC